jgi:hypothetical protein
MATDLTSIAMDIDTNRKDISNHTIIIVGIIAVLTKDIIEVIDPVTHEIIAQAVISKDWLL